MAPLPGERPLRVLSLHSGNIFGGIEVYLVTLARLAAASGLDLELGLAFGGRLRDELAKTGLTVHDTGEVRLSRPWTVARARARVRGLLARGGYDAVLVHSLWSMAVFGPAVRRARVPFVLQMHDDVNPRDPVAQLARFTWPDRVVCNSRFTAGTVDRLYRRVPRDVVFYPVASRAPATGARGETRRALGVTDDEVLLLQASRMQSWKGHPLCIEALSRLRTRARWSLVFAGGAQRDSERAYEASLKAQVADAGLADRVRFLGQRSDVPELMAAADVFVQPNATPEPFGIVFVEALQAALPVVATAMGGALEIVDATCGELAAPGDSAGVAAALTRMIEDPARRAALGAAGRARAAELCDPERQARRITEALAAAAAR